MDKVNIQEKLSLFDDLWSPKIVGEMNGHYVKLAKAKGEFVWHKHEDEDELILVVEGQETIQLRDRDIVLNAGEFFIIPKGVEHKCVTKGASVLLFEPKSTAHTGNVKCDRTVEKEEWI